MHRLARCWGTHAGLVALLVCTAANALGVHFRQGSMTSSVSQGKASLGQQLQGQIVFLKQIPCAQTYGTFGFNLFSTS